MKKINIVEQKKIIVEILAYFDVVVKALRGLRNAVNLRQTVIEAQLERIKYSLF